MTTPFPSVQFLAGNSDGGTRRTVTQRTAETFNVKDYGAVGDGSHNDTTNIQAALTAMWATTYGGGILFFPPGIYKVMAPIDIGNAPNNTNGRIIGSGKGSTLITGVLNNGFIFNQDDNTNGPEELSHMAIVNASTWIGSGAVRVNNTSMVFDDVQFGGMFGLMMPFNIYAAKIRNCNGNSFSDATTGYNGTFAIAGNTANVSDWRSTTPYMVALQFWGSNSCALTGIGIENCVVAVLLGMRMGWASSCTVSGNVLTVGGTMGSSIDPQFEVGDQIFGRGIPLPTWGTGPENFDGITITGLLTGSGFAGTYQLSSSISTISTPIPVISRRTYNASGIVVDALETEGCFYAVHLWSVGGARISGVIATGAPTEPPNAFGTTGYTAKCSIYLFNAAGTVISGCHGKANSYGGAFYIDPNASCGYVTFVSCFGDKLADVVTSSTATISNGSGGAGTILNVPSVASGSTIGIGMSVTGGTTSGGTIITGNHVTDGTVTGTGGAGTYRVNNSQLVAASTLTIHTGTDWVMPTATASKAGLNFINCGGVLPAGVSTGLGTLGMTFTCLPGQAGADTNIQLYEGQEFDIVDCNTSTFLATAAAGGSGSTAHRRVRYNASAAVWQVVG